MLTNFGIDGCSIAVIKYFDAQNNAEAMKCIIHGSKNQHERKL